MRLLHKAALFFFFREQDIRLPKSKIIALRRDSFIDVNCNNQNLIISILL